MHYRIKKHFNCDNEMVNYVCMKDMKLKVFNY